MGSQIFRILTLLEFASTVEEEKDWLIGLEKITTVAQVDLVEGVEKDYICIGSMQVSYTVVTPASEIHMRRSILRTMHGT